MINGVVFLGKYFSFLSLTIFRRVFRNRFTHENKSVCTDTLCESVFSLEEFGLVLNLRLSTHSDNSLEVGRSLDIGNYTLPIESRGIGERILIHSLKSKPHFDSRRD